MHHGPDTGRHREDSAARIVGPVVSPVMMARAFTRSAVVAGSAVAPPVRAISGSGENGRRSENRVILLPFTSGAFEPHSGGFTVPMPSGGGSMIVVPDAASTTYLDLLANTERSAQP